MQRKTIVSLASCIGILAITLFVACKKEQTKSDPKALTAGTPAPSECCTVTNTVVLPEIISSDYNMQCNTLYILDGKTYVTNGATLHIEPGTTIEGVKKANPDSASALVITRGAKIDAQGLECCPIIFTSHEANPVPGDWGGIVILGKAPVNQNNPAIEGINPPTVPGGVDYHFGGNDKCDNSGILEYVRVEFAGASIAPDNELNAFTFGGVGSGTTLNHVQAYYGADDGFEFFGGTVSGKYLLSVACNDDQFDFDFGYQGRLQFVVGILDPNIDYSSNSNGIESDNNATGASVYPRTRPIISNMTLVGTSNCGTTGSGNVQYGMHFRRNSGLVVRNSVIYGYNTATYLDGSAVYSSLTNTKALACSDTTKSQFLDNITNGCVACYNTGWTPSPTNTCAASTAAMGIATPFGLSAYFTNGLRPSAPPALIGADFTGLLDVTCRQCESAVNFFDQVTYRGGAYGPANKYWLAECWVNKVFQYTF
ncbi:hypothetical protein COR50_15405 [Chitinophaga caeni]|uniref:Lipoprotein n=1 Tax=Chitinophaga caeni TaxID=2029983 RepID=A0A291QWX8_9BACT|nr:hypothetical protein [Chitinophaga caeni]ATL48437.1 hypothetical protein COR50_15405 [Chitinophaga caeni]